MSRKLTYEEVKHFISQLGYELISKEYFNNREKLIIADIYEYWYAISYTNLKLRKNPERFHKNNPYTTQNIKLWCQINNKQFELISNDYIDSHKKLKWKCLKLGCGEIFESNWADISQNRGCPYCVGKQVGLSNCLAIKNPELAKEWHSTKNGSLTPYDVTCGSRKKVWWKCSKNHEWESKISDRNNGNGCPSCSGRYVSKEYNLLVCNPELCKEWDYERNKKKPEEYTPCSGHSVWWICSNNPEHRWKTSINNRDKVKNCPYCSKTLPSKEYNLSVVNPMLCGEWNFSKNKNKPENYLPNSCVKVWWICKECRNEWKASITHRNRGRSCPECSKSNGEKKINNYLISNGFIKISKEEYEKLNSKNEKYYIPQKEFKGLVGINGGLLSYDFYLPQFNLLIEYQGIQHEKPIDFNGLGIKRAEKVFKKQQEHDRRKHEYALKNNINLLEIWYLDFDRIEEILNKELNNYK